MSAAAAWRELATDSFEASSQLMAQRRWRSAISRQYYASYSRVAADLADRGVQFGKRGNPTHRAIPGLVLHNLPSLPAGTRARLSNLLDALFKLRVVADYHPGATVDQTDARDSAGLMLRVFQDITGGASDERQRQR